MRTATSPSRRNVTHAVPHLRHGMPLTDVEVAQHLDVEGNVNNDRDADHVAVPPIRSCA
jgi:hypothetical protein